MTAVGDAEHITKAFRESDEGRPDVSHLGLERWASQCSCGWLRRWWRKGGAVDAADIHRVRHRSPTPPMVDDD